MTDAKDDEARRSAPLVLNDYQQRLLNDALAGVLSRHYGRRFTVLREEDTSKDDDR
jgi:hypothetical protein